MNLRNLPLRILWRVLVALAIFNPTGYSLSAYLVQNFQDQPAIAIVILVVIAALLFYMLSIAREFPSVTIFAGCLVLALIVAGHLGQIWNATSRDYWQWAAPVVAGLVLSAGPIYAIIRRREAGVYASDETEDE